MPQLTYPYLVPLNFAAPKESLFNNKINFLKHCGKVLKTDVYLDTKREMKWTVEVIKGQEETG
jgi:hypothetical protein